MSSVAVFEAA